MNELYDLWIVGAGSLGLQIAIQYKKLLPDAQIMAETASTARHETLRANGLGVSIANDPSFSRLKSKCVVYAVPPSHIEKDLSSLKRALLRVHSDSAKFLLISSTAVYAESSGGWIQETSPLSKAARADHLLKMENLVLENHGKVLRLAGIYSASRGPHLYYKKNSYLHHNSNGWINLIHEEDAASLCCSLLLRDSSLKRSIFLGTDSQPLTRDQLVKLCGASCTFSDSDDDLGKKLDNSWTREILDWKPRFASFVEWARLHLP